MEGKCKRFRPSLSAYRELEQRNVVLEDIVRQFSDIEGIVRDNVVYRQAMMNFSHMISAKKSPVILVQGSEECEGLIKLVYSAIMKRWDKDSDKLLNENRALEKSNKYLEDELNRVRMANTNLDLKVSDMENRLSRIMHRSLAERILNTDM